MPLWGKSDAASNSTIYAAAQLKQAPTATNRTALFGNTTANAYFDGVTVGQYAVDGNEITAGGGKVAHTGWVLRTVGQGGRAGRVMTEVLVAGGIGTDASDDAVFPDYVVNILTQPVAATANSANDESVTFRTTTSTTPAGGTVGYEWYYSTTSATAGFATTDSVSGFSGQLTANLTANSATLGANVWVRAVVSVTGGASVNTATVKLTVS